MSLRIISGRLKGKIIPFNNKKFNGADITPQKVKEALFSILGERLDGKVFFDMFGASGQIGFEAYSRGASPVLINEPDRSRFAFIKSFAEEIDSGSDIMLMSLNFHQALRILSRKGVKADFIYLDPPYHKEKIEPKSYDDMIIDIQENSLLAQGGKIIIQHFSKNTLNPVAGSFIADDSRKYGSTTLTFYSTTGK